MQCVSVQCAADETWRQIVVVVAWASIHNSPATAIPVCHRTFASMNAVGSCAVHIALWTRVWLALTSRRLGLIARSRHSIDKCRRCLQPYTSRPHCATFSPAPPIQPSSPSILGLYASLTLWCSQSSVTTVRRYTIGWTRCQSRRVIGREAVTSRSTRKDDNGPWEATVISDQLMTTTFVVTFDIVGAAKIHLTSGSVLLSVPFGEWTS